MALSRYVLMYIEQGEGLLFAVQILIFMIKGEKKEITPDDFMLKDKSFLSGYNVLIADDDLTSCMLLENILKMEGAEVVVATNGREAIEIYQAKANFDLVLMDLKMPKIDGFEAIREIIARDEDAKIIAQSSYDLDEERQRCLDLGCLDYLTKPIDNDLLKTTLKRALSKIL